MPPGQQQGGAAEGEHQSNQQQFKSSRSPCNVSLHAHSDLSVWPADKLSGQISHVLLLVLVT